MDVLRAVKRTPWIFPMACIAVAGMIFISEGSYWQSALKLDRLGAMAVVPTSLQELQWGILDAEAARRADTRSDSAEGRQTQLLAYSKAMQSITGAFTTLDAYYNTQSQPTALLAGLHRMAEAKLAGRNSTGPEEMDAIRALSAQLLQFEATNVVNGRASLYGTLMLGRIGVTILSLAGLLTMFVVLRQSAALEAHRREQQRLIQSAHDLLEVEVLQRTSELTDLTHHLQTAREDERTRLARDLHDEMGALMTSAKLDAARIRSRLVAMPTPAPEALERLAHLTETLNSGIALKRRIVEDLHPSSLSMLGLVATLEIMAREFADSSGVRVSCKLEVVQLSARANLMIYRLMQEGLTNISKYAQANHVWLALSSRDGLVEASVRDDGVGFDAQIPSSSAHGLLGMRFRVEAEGGSMRIVTAPGLGTLITARLQELAPSTKVPVVASEA